MLTCIWVHDPMIAGQPILLLPWMVWHHHISSNKSCKTVSPLDVNRLVVDLRERHLENWTPYSGTIYNTHTLKSFKKLGLDSQRVKKLASKLHAMCTLWTSPNLSIPDVPFPVLLSTLVRSRFQAKPATLLIPIDFSDFPFRGGGALRYLVPKWLLFLT